MGFCFFKIRVGSLYANGKEGLAILHGLSIDRQHLDDFPGRIRFNLIHELHGLNDAKYLAGLDHVSGLYKGWRSGSRRFVECPDNRRLNDVQLFLRLSSRRLGHRRRG
jgi:hypothetical protein